MKAKALPLALLLVAAALPLAQVSAHTCNTTTTQPPSSPNDPDTGCVGYSCPCQSAPHNHKNTVPSDSCSKNAEDCDDRGGGHGCRPPPDDLHVITFRTVDFQVGCALVGPVVVIIGRGVAGDVVDVHALP